MTKARPWLAALVALGMASCHLVTPFDPTRREDAGVDGALDGRADSEEVDGDVADALPDGDTPSGGGSLVHVISSVVVSTNRVCDVNGDGELDNSIADLGDESGDVLAAAFGAVLAAALAENERPVFHYRWIDDLAGPNADGATVAAYTGLDADYPPDSTDDLSGSEPFYVAGDDLDSCGEPLHRTADIHIEGGAVSGGEGTFTLAVEGGSITFNTSELAGTMFRRGARFEGTLCGFFRTRELDTDAGLPLAPGLTILEVLLAGGSVFGLLAVPGVSLDLDLDEDGLESFELDEDGRISRCIDGDHTVIDGRDCWRDPRMADAFSMTFEVAAVTAVFAGREPGWEYIVPVGCEPWPPTESFFDTATTPSESECAELDGLCNPNASLPCCDVTHRCSGANMRTRRCYAPCESPECPFGPTPASCHLPTWHDASLCWPVDDDLTEGGCTLGEPCTSVHGDSVGTTCVDVPYHGTYCALTCTGPTDGCGDDHRCVPLPFEEGSVCAFMPGWDPLST